MRCRRICRELLWLARFGEFGPSSQPHLDHLAGCRNCRDEVGYDREMVEQLRIALARRIENASPSPTAWEGILARAQAPEPAAVVRVWAWSAGLVGRIRWATAMAAPGLALVLALNMEIVPVGAPSTTDAAAAVAERTSLQQVPRLPVERSSLAYLTRAWGGSGGAVAQPDPEAALTFAARVQPPVRSAETEVSEPAPTTELRLVIRPLQTHDPGPIRSPAAIEREGHRPELINSEAGQPS